ncbi:hypothetical protein CPJCM30710_25200 [Clostridium polyendosporum]|uniref:Uncharacterized protein n=1 Tax=Clostridium polyendosporum TaxID=69208 RepID=A0A919S1R7_9CLOT|nr:hypothetical protein [Clostridium polyendosporum]GIM29854.1 hypothetical protein CPJCM30710_25200 [Clostridium polyendosporum]
MNEKEFIIKRLIELGVITLGESGKVYFQQNHVCQHTREEITYINSTPTTLKFNKDNEISHCIEHSNHKI